jgi:predicted ATPase
MNKVSDIIKEMHIYSGINEEMYSSFFATIQLAKKKREHVKESQQMLHQAIQTLNNIPMYMSPIDTDVQDKIAEISQRLGYEFESVLMNEAINRDLNFKPKYI